MANIIGSLTLNQTRFVELDAHPLSSPTPDLEIGDFCLADGIVGIWQKTGAGDYDFSRIDLLTNVSQQSTSAGTLVLAGTSSTVQIFTGSASGQIVQLPNATNLSFTTRYEIWNISSQNISVVDNGSNSVRTLIPNEVALIILSDNSTPNGVWNNVAISPSSTTFGSPVSISDSTNSDGVSTSVARSDHVHSHGTRGGGTLHAAATTSVAGFMSGADKTKLDGVATGATNTPLTAVAPVNVTKAAASVGVSTAAARSDHKHDVTTAAPSTNLTASTTNAEGSATSLARSDHTHAITTATPSSQTPDQANFAGSAAQLARADHIHAIPTGIASTIGTANSQGSAAAFARQDHIHNHGAQTDPTHHAVATTSTNGFMSAADKTALDGKANLAGGNTFTGNQTINSGSLNIGGTTIQSSGEWNVAAGAYTDPDVGTLYDAKFGGPNRGIVVRGLSYFLDKLGIGVQTPVASAKVQIDSTTQGFLPPRMTTAQRTAIASPAAGLEVYDTTLNKSFFFNGTVWVGGSVFGENYIYSESLGLSTVASTTFTEKLTIDAIGVPAGTYRIAWNFTWYCTDANNDFRAQVQLNNSTTLWTMQQEPQDVGTDQRHPAAGFAKVVLTAGDHSLDLDYSRSAGTGTVGIANARMEFWRVS